jgi:hydrogenase 3 maturation protease
MSGEKTIPPAEGPIADWRSGISKELKKAKRLFVLGVGNRRKGDDAAGNLCLRLLRKQMARKSAPRELRVLDAGETPESATGLIRDFRPTHILIVDAAVGGHQPGTIFFIDKEKIGHEDVSTHRLPLFHLVRYLEESIGCRVILVGIEPQEAAWGKPVSATVRAAVTDLAAYLAEAWTERRPK